MNHVEEDGQVLLVGLSMGKTAILDNNETNKELLKSHAFYAIKVATIHGDVYYAVTYGMHRKRLYLHRMVVGPALQEGKRVHHLDGNSLNCCVGNLVAKSCAEQMHDAKRQRNPVPGIYKRSDCWLASWRTSAPDGKKHYRLFKYKYCSEDRAYELAKQHVRLMKAYE